MRIPILKVKKPEVNKDFQNSPSIFRNSRLEVFYKKGVLRNFTTFARTHLYHGLFFNKVAG